MAGCDRGEPAKHRDNTWRHLDESRSCRKCGLIGLRYGSTSGFCGKCWSKLSGLVKANINDFALEHVVERYKLAMVDEFGLTEAAEMMRVDPTGLRADLERYKSRS